jgi:GLPGLI family protein
MKKVIRIILSLVLLIGVLSVNSYAGDKSFRGVIVYNISFGEDMDASMVAMMPKTMKMYISGDKSKMEMIAGFGTTNVIFDSETKESVVMMDMMGQKFAIKSTAEDIEKELEEAPNTVVEVTDETKEIAGYTCKKAIVTVEGEDTELIVYFTDELGGGQFNGSNPFYNKIDGVMLEFVMLENDIEMSYKAISVEKKKVSDEMFDIPVEYKIVTEEELQGMFGG